MLFLWDNIRAVIPQMAMSAGTMIACSCKEIIMGKHSSLGPVDPQIIDVSAQAVLEEFELAKIETAENPEFIPFWTILLDKYPSNIYFECKHAIEWTKELLEKSLRYSMFKENTNLKKIPKIIHELISIDTTKDHSRNLSAEKCRKIGLTIKYLEDDEELQDIILSIHHAGISYFNHRDVFKIFVNQNGVFLAQKSD